MFFLFLIIISVYLFRAALYELILVLHKDALIHCVQAQTTSRFSPLRHGTPQLSTEMNIQIVRFLGAN
jgi:hypothetical protein